MAHPNPKTNSAFLDVFSLRSEKVYLKISHFDTPPVERGRTVAEAESESAGTLTLLLHRARDGDDDAREQFCSLVYEKLRGIAGGRIHCNGSPGQSSSLVNDLFLQLLERDQIWEMPNRRYFFAVAIDQMRKILVDHYRKRKSVKAGGNYRRTPLDEVLDCLVVSPDSDVRWNLLDLESALEKLKLFSPRQYEVVLHRFYGGLSNQETADNLGVSLGTVERDWRLARSKLLLLLRGHNDEA